MGACCSTPPHLRGSSYLHGCGLPRWTGRWPGKSPLQPRPRRSRASGTPAGSGTATGTNPSSSGSQIPAHTHTQTHKWAWWKSSTPANQSVSVSVSVCVCVRAPLRWGTDFLHLPGSGTELSGTLPLWNASSEPPRTAERTSQNQSQPDGTSQNSSKAVRPRWS